MTNNKLGRPTLSENKKTVNLSISITEAQAKFLKEHGFGNVSLGIRRLVDERKNEDTTDLPNQEDPD